MAKDPSIGLLLDCYGGLLTETRRETAEMYYYEDLSHAEIAMIQNITRQGVHECLRHANEQLVHYEMALGLSEKLVYLRMHLEEILTASEQGDCDMVQHITKDCIEKISR